MRPENYFQAAQAYLVASARSKRDRHGTDQPLPFLTLSRQCGAGAHRLAERIVERLRPAESELPWAIFDDNLVQEVLRKHDLPDHISRYMSEDRVAEVQDLVEVTLGLHPPVDTLVRKVNSTIITLARMGHVILIGRGSHALTRSMSGGLHVRLIADVEKRREELMARHDFSEREATAHLERLDEGRRAYVKRHCGEDVDDPMAYDLVVNMSGQSVESVSGMLVDRISARAARSLVLPD